MTSLKCWNSGVESNGATFILLPSVSGFVSRVPGAFGREVSSNSFFRFASQLLVSNSASHDLFHDSGEALRISGFAIVIAESLFVKVPEQMERLNTDVGSVQTTLQETPEVLHCVRVNGPVRILDCVIDNGVLVVVR